AHVTGFISALAAPTASTLHAPHPCVPAHPTPTVPCHAQAHPRVSIDLNSHHTAQPYCEAIVHLPFGAMPQSPRQRVGLFQTVSRRPRCSPYRMNTSWERALPRHAAPCPVHSCTWLRWTEHVLLAATPSLTPPRAPRALAYGPLDASVTQSTAG